MTDKKKNKVEFYFRSIADDESVLALLGMGYKQEDPGKKHFHNLLEIAVCRRGNGEILTEKRKYSYSEGTIIIVPANEVHAIVSKDTENSFWEYIYIDPFVFLEQTELFKKHRKFSRYLMRNHVIVRDKEEVLFLSTEVNILMDQIRVKEYGYSQCVWGLTYVLLMEIIKLNHELDEKQVVSGKMNDRNSTNIIRVLDYVDMHYFEDIHTSDIAKEAYISESALRKLFHEYFDMSPTQYVNSVRIRKACNLIRHTDSSITEIARSVGYENLSTFINKFKLYTGDTPSKWKEKN